MDSILLLSSPSNFGWNYLSLVGQLVRSLQTLFGTGHSCQLRCCSESMEKEMPERNCSSEYLPKAPTQYPQAPTFPYGHSLAHVAGKKS